MRRRELYLLIATSGVDARTLRRYLRGDDVRETTIERIVSAAASLKIKLPQPPKTAANVAADPVAEAMR